ncbi:hypothetical protein [Stratiformator vulcanicus]|uniref:Uncharacterized protein n=1 Tax=Stratiformator vulcanicus TaxID=2527980 RepID=A0A517R1H8_9PLAN|nr:hypothetical protein [Stratiformator vulcanicus]QDT37765.1 hypothetical protein Pan189_21470 [Stratiformator vulcanicus]
MSPRTALRLSLVWSPYLFFIALPIIEVASEPSVVEDYPPFILALIYFFWAYVGFVITVVAYHLTRPRQH